MRNIARIPPETWTMQGMLDLVPCSSLRKAPIDAGVLLGITVVSAIAGVRYFRYG